MRGSTTGRTAARRTGIGLDSRASDSRNDQDDPHHRRHRRLRPSRRARFADGGWQVIGTGRRADRLRELADELGDAFLPLEIDMRDREAIDGLAGLSPPWGDIDLLLNNAGLAPPMSPLQDADWEPIDTVIDTNVTGLVALTRALLPKLIERKGPDHQPVVGRGDLSLQGRRGLRRDQGLRPPILARPALRPRRHRACA